MENTSNALYTIEEIFTSWEETWPKVRNFVQEETPDTFLRKPENFWSMGQHFEHLILSAVPVAKALNAPKMVLRPFGKPNRPSRTFDGLVTRYHERLEDAPATISSPYAAKDDQPLDQTEMLARWQKAGEKLSQAIQKWKEEDLDKFLMPHPLLGKLTVREMLFFTIFHTQHHLMRMEETVAGKRDS